MKTKIQQLLPIFLMGLLLLPSCIKEETYRTYHPDHGLIAPDIDWSDVDLPNPDDELIIIIGDETIIVKEGEQPKEEILLPPGKEEVIVINNPDGTTLDENGVIHVDTDDDGNIIPDPEIVIGDYEEIVVEKDKEMIVPIRPKQLTRQLTIKVKMIGGDIARIQSITGTLSNIARSYDLKADKETNAGTVKFDFIKNTDFSTKMNLFGIINTPQTLTLHIIYTDGSQESIPRDVSDLLRDFNKDKKTPMSITTDLELASEIGFSATITPWEKVDKGNGTAN